MKFKLLFLSEGQGWTNRKEAYVCALPSGDYIKPDPRAGHVLLSNECVNEAQCHAAIERLISDLQKLKAEVSRKFRNETV
jgi:hypothetical protein